MSSMSSESPVERLLALRQHQHQGKRSPHKPLLVLLALGQLANAGTSAVSWDACSDQLGELIKEFGPPSQTSTRQAAAYPFTRLRSDQMWTLSVDVVMDRIGALDSQPVVGQFTTDVEQALKDPVVLRDTARALVEAEFPPSIIPDVLTAVGLDPDMIYGSVVVPLPVRRRSANWPAQVLRAWNRQCAFCGFDGQLGTASVGLEAAHVRWFNFDGPDDPDNGLALCSLHHKLFDRGALGLTDDFTITVSKDYVARTESGQQVFALHGAPLRVSRPDVVLPATVHVVWHREQVFKGEAMAS